MVLGAGCLPRGAASGFRVKNTCLGVVRLPFDSCEMQRYVNERIS